MIKLREQRNVMTVGYLYTDDDRQARTMLPSVVLEAIDQLARENSRSRAMEIRHRILSVEEIKDAVERIRKMREDIGDFPDLET